MEILKSLFRSIVRLVAINIALILFFASAPQHRGHLLTIVSVWAVNLVRSCPIVAVFSQITIVSEAVVAILKIARSLAPDHITSERLYKIRAAGTDEFPH